MAWFSPATIDFFAELTLHNDRDWFAANKKRYEKEVKAPFEAFASVMVGRMRELDSNITIEPKKAISRIHRDTRFSKDKSPYKTNMYLMISSGGKGDMATPGLYFNLGAQNLGIASGLYMLEPDQIAAVRRHLIANPKELAERLADKDFARLFGGIKGEANKILPPEFKEAAAKEPLIFNKQFFYWTEHSPEEAFRDDLDEFVMDHMRAAWPMNEFLFQAIR